ncbi:MAG: hypothetical protein AAF074_15855 [Pseudomonadota bacterium]
MPFRYPRTGTVQATWATTLQSHMFNNPGIKPYDETFAYMEAVRRWAMRSPTAQRLIETVDNSAKVINVVGMDGGFSCFSNDDPVVGQGTIFMDLEARFRIGGPGTGINPFSQGGQLHHYIAMLHEIGHAVQFIESPAMFDQGAKGPLSALKGDIMNAARAHVGRTQHYNYGQQRAFTGNGTMQGTATWAVRLEYDNMSRHEWPICRESGYGCRPHYSAIHLSRQSPFAV